jgi:hypothetical protein
MKYPLLLCELLKHTPDSCPDYPQLKIAAGAIKDTVEQINSEKDAVDQIHHVSQVTDKLEFSEYLRSTHSPLRRVLCDGNLSKLSKGLMSRSSSSRYAVLFNDVFVLASRGSGRKSISKIIPRENIVGCYDMNHSDGLRFSLRYIDQKIVEVQFLAHSPSHKSKWVSGFKELIRKRKTSSGMISYSYFLVSSVDTAVNEDEKPLPISFNDEIPLHINEDEGYPRLPTLASTSEIYQEPEKKEGNSFILDDFISAYLHYDPNKRASEGASPKNVPQRAESGAGSGSPPRATARQHIGAAAFHARKLLFSSSASSSSSVSSSSTSKRSLSRTEPIVSSTNSIETTIEPVEIEKIEPIDIEIIEPVVLSPTDEGVRRLARQRKSADLKTLGYVAPEIEPARLFEGWSSLAIFNVGVLSAAIVFWVIRWFFMSLFLIGLLLVHNY